MAVHTGDKYKDIVASGQIGELPTIHIWDAQTRKTLSVLSGKHKRGKYIFLINQLLLVEDVYTASLHNHSFSPIGLYLVL
jgi:hypothetical protein